MSKVLEQVEEIVLPIATELQLELVDLAFEKEGKHWYLRVFLDKEDGIDIDECALVSERLSEILDKNDPITQNYFLEVSSPGAERPLKKGKKILKLLSVSGFTLQATNRLQTVKCGKEHLQNMMASR
ncbi:ribosome maturation protein RimP [Listeria rocourtiae FSL F6-920]|nr:ribosome maturation protein RimP [Listeria rocourtiae FSL F6-920]